MKISQVLFTNKDSFCVNSTDVMEKLYRRQGEKNRISFILIPLSLLVVVQLWYVGWHMLRGAELVVVDGDAPII